MLVPTKDLVKKQLKAALKDLPQRWNNNYDQSAKQSLLQVLFRSLVGGNEQYLQELFCGNVPANDDWILRDAQGAVEGAEYTEAARGKPCGHILKGGEATYRCKTCTNDDTCVLCSRCFEASDHRGHMVSVSISPGNSGCCDCGDEEAWKIPVHCAIHSAHRSNASGKQPEHPQLPQDLIDSITATIGGALDYFCDVISCAPEELRKSKTEASIMEDEEQARLLESVYGSPDEVEQNPEYALVLWNDEKHAVHEVQEQVARACRKSKAFGLERANETDEVGRSFIMTSRDLKDLLHKARIIEQIKITVTIRSARDTFREQTCSTIVEWLLDIAGCRVGPDNNILTHTVCSEMLQPWEKGSHGSNSGVGRDGIFDHEIEEGTAERLLLRRAPVRDIAMNADGGLTITVLPAETTDVDNEEDDDDDDIALDQVGGQDAMDVDAENGDGDFDMPSGDASDPLRGDAEDSLENSEATLAGYPPPPPPPPVGTVRGSSNPASSAGSAILTPPESTAAANIPIPQTPFTHARPRRRPNIPLYWLQEGAFGDQDMPLAEDIRQRVRLDWMILYDLRLWKKARIDLRDLYIGTMVTLPDFKRILGLRFAGLYTLLAQVYLIADREPDHSIIYMSLQMLTTPSITREVVNRCNFLTTLIAILYTFLTTRQVGRPMDMSPNATLAFDAGSVTNRRMYHFFCDLKHLFQNAYVQEQLREHRHYTLQFLDLIKLAQGICPNVRAVGEHVEYENDAWISASILTREVNKLCRQFADAFRLPPSQDSTSVRDTIRIVTLATIGNCLGLEKERFTQAEVRALASFKTLNPKDWEVDHEQLKPIVEFQVGGSSPMSFHHAMHYTLSWLIDGVKDISIDNLRELLTFKPANLNHPKMTQQLLQYTPEDYLMVLFDYPLRVCAWLAQMKAGMWVRNGLSLRHQMSQYRGVNQRNLAHQHDIFLLQVAMVTCEPNRVLLSIIDRFGMADWMRGRFTLPERMEDSQMIDVAEDFVHLLIVLLSERTTLQPLQNEEEQLSISIRRDLTHVLCFKPLSYSDLCQRLIDRFQDLDEFQDILNEMAIFKAPEGLSDTGTFELKKEYLADLDPYIAHYTKNQRDEAETTYRRWVSQSTGKPLSEVVFEPHLRPITSGIFVGLRNFVGQPIFAQIIGNCLLYALSSEQFTPSIPITRVESFLQVVLHLTLVALNEDPSHEDSMNDDASQSFVNRLLTRTESGKENATFGRLYSLLARKDFEACHAKIKQILLRAQEKRPKLFEKACEARGVRDERPEWTPSVDTTQDELQKKKKAESEARAKRALASMRRQQDDFLNNKQNFDWGSDLDDDDSLASPGEQTVQMWDYPSGNCIYCQEECSDDRLYGTFALIKESRILRVTDTRDPDYVQEVLETPDSLDRSAEAIRPFGLAGKNRDIVNKLNASGEAITIERQTLGKGFKPSNSTTGPVSSSCGHIMHFSCFESYNNATIRRQTHQIARHPPERLGKMEFVCPLCKALGNSFLPIIWKGKEKRYPGVLTSDTTFDEWILVGLKAAMTRDGKTRAVLNTTSNHLSGEDANQTMTDSSSVLLPSLSTDLSEQASQGHININRIHDLPMPGNFPDDIYSTSPPLESAQTSTSGKAMSNVYYRLRETIRKNHLASDFKPGQTEHLAHTDALARALGHSIAAVEIAQRGVESETAGLFVDQVSMVTMTHLRVLSDMISSYISAGAAQDKDSGVSLEIRTMVNKEAQQLFRGHPEIFDSMPSYAGIRPALTEDPFGLLAECVLYLVPKMHVSYNHIIRICYLLEVAKNVHVVWRDAMDGFGLREIEASAVGQGNDEQAFAFREFLKWSNLLSTNTRFDEEQINKLCIHGIRRIRPNILTFLRKVALLVTVTRGVDFAGAGFMDPSQPELERLSHALQLPSLESMLGSAGAAQEQSLAYLQSTVKGWYDHLYKTFGTGSGSLSVSGMVTTRPTHPVIYELVGLPKYYDTLLDEMTRRKCPTKENKDMMDPAVCLFCGEMMCSQSVCCMIRGKGGCNRHMQKCGGDIGLFLHLRKCMVLYLHDGSGSWAQCPYLDRHGETDPGLRRNRQLILNQKRYDALLRNVWLGHMIPTTISRKLEADINNGGWETL